MNNRLAPVLRRLRWPVAVLWVLGIVLLVPLANGLTTVTNDTVSAFLPSGAQSARVASLKQVLLDTLFIRTVLVPAAFLTIGDRVWWPGGPGPRTRTRRTGTRPTGTRRTEQATGTAG